MNYHKFILVVLYARITVISDLNCCTHLDCFICRSNIERSDCRTIQKQAMSIIHGISYTTLAGGC